MTRAEGRASRVQFDRAKIVHRALLAALNFEASYDPTKRELTIMRGSRVLLLDDTYTSGATLQSAASALQMASAQVVAVAVVGRYVKPDFSDDTRALWDAVTSETFTFDSCCLEK